MQTQPSRTAAAIAVSSLVGAALATAPVAGIADIPRFVAADRAVDQAIADQRLVGAVVLIAQHGRVVHRHVAGLADREAHTPMREDALFLYSSMTKPIVTVAALRLVEQGRLGLDDPVTRWLPDFRPRTADGRTPTITLRQLLSHSAGLDYEFQQPADGDYQRLGVSSGLDDIAVSLPENLQRLAQAPLAYEPGKAWRYSMAMDVVGAVIEKASGQSLPDAVKTLVTDPLAMRDARFGVADAERLATPYGEPQPSPVRMPAHYTGQIFGNAIRYAPERLHDPKAWPSGGAGMAGTAGDFMRLAAALSVGGGRILKRETVAEMTRAQVGPEAQTLGPGWGFGFGGAVLADPALAGSPQGKGTLLWGGVYGHYWFIDPQRELAVALFTNTAIEGMVGPVTTALRDAVYAGLEAR